MKETDMILQMAQENNGTITTAMVTEAGISRGNLKYLTDTGKLERSGRGVYVLPEIWEDELFAVQNRFKRGIFSCDTALFLWNMTDRTPNKFCMTFPATETKTPAHNTVRVYNRERTLCDILKKSNQIDIQLITQAFKEYTTLPDKNIALLSDYSKLFRVSEKVRSYLEVLL